MTLTVEQARRLHGIEDSWHMAPDEENFLVRSAESLVQEHGEDWVREHQEFLRLELRYIFQVFLLGCSALGMPSKSTSSKPLPL